MRQVLIICSTVMQDLKVDLDKPIVTMCNSGMTSCSLMLALKRVGARNISLYQVGSLFAPLSLVSMVLSDIEIKIKRYKVRKTKILIHLR